VDAAATSATKRTYLFRGDDKYASGSVGLAWGADGDAADIQNAADHVLRKESRRSSRYMSFTEDIKIARRFTSAPDNRHVCKVEVAALPNLVARGVIRMWNPDRVYEALLASGKKLAKQAADVRTTMRRNNEILIEGQIPASILEPTS
jgi:hypothetical protein